jgi:hypothetical protein
MFPQQPQQQFSKAGADVQIFYGSVGVANASQRSWNKPPGVSHIYMMLIGGGGNGDGSDAGGGSGAVTVWYGAARNVPDSLVVVPSRGGTIDTTITARFSNSALTPTALLTASVGNGIGGGALMAANQFTASGFFQSVAGQDGNAGNTSASTTTFLGGGGGGTSNTGNYGYTLSGGINGYLMLQPIIVGLGGADNSVNVSKGGIGCGGGLFGGGVGGPGMVLIASW